MTTTTTATVPAAPASSPSKATMIRPGLMVLVRSSVAGGVSYQRTDLDAEKAGIVPVTAEDGTVTGFTCPACDQSWGVNEPEAHRQDSRRMEEYTDGRAEWVGESACPIGQRTVTRWETTKVVDAPTEFAAASKVRNQARSIIRKCCASTSFGMLCPEAREEELDQAIQAARDLVAAHNRAASHTQVHVYALKGRIASDDRQAVRIISAEVRDLVADMSRSIDKLDTKGIREAADKAREVGAMLAPEQSAIVAEAVKQARAAARQIVARVEGKGEDAKVVLADVQRGSIEKARIAFLDLDDGPGVVGAAMPAVNVQRFADMGDDGAQVEGQVA